MALHLVKFGLHPSGDLVPCIDDEAPLKRRREKAWLTDLQD